jgi:hypothetical protein
MAAQVPQKLSQHIHSLVEPFDEGGIIAYRSIAKCQSINV